MPTHHTLKKNQRLKSRKRIEAVFKTGRSFSVFPYRVIYQIEPAPNFTLQAAFSASSKSFKKAVHRNRIKRLTREAYRTQVHELEEYLKTRDKCLSIFFVYTGKELPEYDLVKMKISVALQQLIKRINEGGAQSS